MKYLIYMSTAVRLFNYAELKEILRESQANNLVNGITGMLLYSQGSFVQVLEGYDEDVDLIYSKILKDNRHHKIIKLTEANIKTRLFPDWSMGFKTVLPAEISKFDAYIDPREHHIWQNTERHPAIAILQTFAHTNDF